MTTARSAIRPGIVDSDSGLQTVLARRLQWAGWQHRVFASPVPADALVAMRLDALVIDLDVLGPQAWSYLEMVCERLALMAVLVYTGRSTVAQRVRALRLGADDWIGKPCHPEELLARVSKPSSGAAGGQKRRQPQSLSWPAGSRSAPTTTRCWPARSPPTSRDASSSSSAS
jgi:DNA-binding response OmpR family regulator